MASDSMEIMRFDAVRGKHLLIALSGGADSVFLTHRLFQARAAQQLQLTAAHLNHGIRGEAADEDAAFCEALCKQLGIPLIHEKLDLPSLAQARKMGLETAAREERYRFLERARALCGADYIALAQHLDDQSETVLMHLFRGSGPEGISGMEEFSGTLYRPMLGIDKRSIQAFLLENGINWREDATNSVADNPRNQLRLNVMPAIEKSYPSAAQAIARYAKSARLESDYIARQTKLFLAQNVFCGPYGWRIDLRQAPEEVLLRRAIRKICGPALCADKLDELIALSNKQRGKTTVFQALFAEKLPNCLYFLPKDREKPAEVPLLLSGSTSFGSYCRIRAEETADEPPRENPMVQIVNAEMLENAVVRTRRPGDRFYPLGAPGDRLLSDYLTDRKLDRPLRDWIPLIAVKDRIYWVGGIGISEEIKLDPCTRRRVRLCLVPTTDNQPEV